MIRLPALFTRCSTFRLWQCASLLFLTTNETKRNSQALPQRQNEFNVVRVPRRQVNHSTRPLSLAEKTAVTSPHASLFEVRCENDEANKLFVYAAGTSQAGLIACARFSVLFALSDNLMWIILLQLTCPDMALKATGPLRRCRVNSHAWIFSKQICLHG